MSSTRIGYLSCPECGEDAVSSSGYGCLGCIAGGHERGADDCERIPLWTEGDGCQCPACGTRLRVVVDDDRAYAATVVP